MSLTVPAHALVALVGPSGAGKSTAFALINRFYEPWSGSIRIDGRPATDLGLTEWRSHLGWVEQDCPILHGTLRDNLCYAAPDVTDDRLWEVLDLVNLTGKVHGLTAGLDTEVGERGVRLSSGGHRRHALRRHGRRHRHVRRVPPHRPGIPAALRTPADRGPRLRHPAGQPARGSKRSPPRTQRPRRMTATRS
ncbi:MULTISPECIES: ABC transporter ATP-binding protein [unclassified Kitasatospora]|uniref:ABC transporter ATP-binding protein n=1 Tax=unclassified Kitasatospora TaxID=2633591 RepID=UPI003447C14C